MCGRACNKFFSAITLEMCTDNWIDVDDVVAGVVVVVFVEFLLLLLLQFLFSNNLSSMLLVSVSGSLSFASYHVKLFDSSNMFISNGPIGSIIR